MTSPATVARHESALRQLELRLFHKLDGLLAGDHLGFFHGAGSEAGDARTYQPGDDARRIDWNLSARAGEPYVRETIADRELETWLVVDSTASLDFGTATCEKRDLALAAAGAFGLLTARAGNRVGAVVFDGEDSTIVPPRSGRDAVMAILRRLEQQPRGDGGAGALAAGIRRCRQVARRRGVIVVVSDLIDRSDWQRELRAAAAHHEVLVAELADPREDELPPVGLLTLVDPETGRRIEVQTGNPELRQRFAAAAAEQRQAARDTARRAGAEYLCLSTDRDWLLDVVRFTVARRRRR